MSNPKKLEFSLPDMNAIDFVRSVVLQLLKVPPLDKVTAPTSNGTTYSLVRFTELEDSQPKRAEETLHLKPIDGVGATLIEAVQDAGKVIALLAESEAGEGGAAVDKRTYVVLLRTVSLSVNAASGKPFHITVWAAVKFIP